MKVVVTNDDGIDAPGLAALEQVALKLGCEIVLVAPATHQSFMGHRVTTTEPLAVVERARNRFSVGGTPADCVRVALRCLAPDAAWLIAGINQGANLGADTYISGTVGAAREATLLGCPAIAISQYVAARRHADWEAAARRAEGTLRRLMEGRVGPGPATGNGLGRHWFWNVNLPHPEDAWSGCDEVVCPLDTSPFDVRYRREGDRYFYEGNYHERPRKPGSDIDWCFRGRIAITAITLDPAPL